jgi:hypothetical protein
MNYLCASVIFISSDRLDLSDPSADPSHHGPGPAVSQNFIARTIRARLCLLSTPWNQRVIVGEALKPFRIPSA